MKLSICIVTMNRASQLKEAIESCLQCELPKETEFIIIDNASTDNTTDIVNNIFSGVNNKLYYEKLKTNIGAGRGRNYAFNIGKGEYIYGLDDDAVIDFKNNRNFFVEAINIMDLNKDIISLTTQIYDTAWKENRVVLKKKAFKDKLYYNYMFYGGSHFLRKNFFIKDPYFPNQYGLEELLPSLNVWNNNFINVSYPKLRVVHKPLVNKWDYSDEKNHELLIKEIALRYGMKVIFYPKIFKPILYFSYKIRSIKYLTNKKNYKEKSKKVIDDILLYDKDFEKIKVSTVLKLYHKFGISIF